MRGLLSCSVLAAVVGIVAAVAPPPAFAAGGPKAADYVCHNDNPQGNSYEGQFRLQIRNGSTYATLYTGQRPKKGKYTVDADRRLTFTTGPLAGFYGKVLIDETIGISSRPGETMFNTVCLFGK